MYWAQGPVPDRAHIEEKERDAAAQWQARTDFHASVFRKDDGGFVGKISLFDHDRATPKATLAYWADTRHTGDGAMTEAGARLVEFGFSALGLRRIGLDCDPRNTRSASLARRLGFVPEGWIRSSGLDPQGGVRDTLLFGLLPGDPRLTAQEAARYNRRGGM
jgi:RimJ/RimL family protein N-acetyltransferase